MKVLLDHNLDRRPKRYLTGCVAATAQEQGWSDVLNGELLTLAESNGFDVLLTADSNIKNQQNLSNHRISILVVQSFNNRLTTHVEMIDQIHHALSEMRPAQIVEIFHHDMTAS